MLETAALLTVPLQRGGRTVGRIYVLDEALPQFDEDELEFLSEAGAHLLLIIDKLDLLDQLASLAARRERRRLANDLHDLAIQPYLGLQLGIEAALRRPGCPAPLAEDLRALLQLARQGTEELRRMLAGQGGASGGEDLLAESLTRLARQYGQFGIEVGIDYPQDLRVSDRLSAELIAMISEGLSNVRRHTGSRWARLALAGEGDALHLAIANACEAGCDGSFLPKSIHERATALGGETQVRCTDAGETVVSVRIPL
jgi:signal transduction histidine kinase